MTHQLVMCLTCATEHDLVREDHGVVPLTSCPHCGGVSWTESQATEPALEWASRDVLTVDANDTLETARAAMIARRIQHLLVVENGVVIGVLAERDLLAALSPAADTPFATERDQATLRKRAHQAMSHSVIAVAAETTVGEAIRTLLANRIHCLPLLREDGSCEGVFTTTDALRWATRAAA